MFQANLMKNFRCHQQILKFASEMFYKSLVTPSHVTSSCWSHPGFSFPLVFVCTSKEIVDHYDKAVNRDEASIVMGMLGKNLEIEPKNVCVMSSSRGQVSKYMCSKYFHRIHISEITSSKGSTKIQNLRALSSDLSIVRALQIAQGFLNLRRSHGLII